MPKVSVIMPVYNSEKYVEAAVRSVLDQSFKDFELLLIDDASTDGSLSVCQSLAKTDPRVKIIRRAQNGGCSVAKNTGLDNASGKYVAFVDSDDLSPVGAMQFFVNAAEQNRADIVWAPNVFRRTYLGDGKFTEPKLAGRVFKSRGQMLSNNRNARLKEFFVSKNYLVVSALFFCRRDFFTKNKLRFPTAIFQVVPFAVAMFALADRMFITPRPCYVYSRREGSIIHSADTLPLLEEDDPVKSTEHFLNELFEKVPDKLVSAEVKSLCRRRADHRIKSLKEMIRRHVERRKK